MSNRYILEGKRPVPCDDLITWAKWLETAGSKRRVGDTTVNGHRVSTVFLGLDHRFGCEGLPILFETLVFPDDTLTEVDGKRYCSWEDAEAGHAEFVTKWSNKPCEPTK